MKISIIIPVYNVEKYILRCLKSVAAQTVTDGIECIIVDDCGQDNSVALCEDFVKSYKGNVRFSIFHNERNKGLSGARNSGIRAAKGEYLYFLDGDDEIKEDCLAGFLHIARIHPHVNLIQGLFENDSEYMKSFLTKYIPLYTEDCKLIKSILLDYDALPVTAANKFVRADIIKNNNIFFKEGIIHEDNHWSFFLAKHVESFALYRNQCYIYYTNPGSIMTAPKRYKEMLSFQTMLKDFAANIDPFMMGAQKRAIFLVLLTILGNKYYDSEEERQSLIDVFFAKNNVLEQWLLGLCLRLSPTSKLYGRMINLLFRIYKLEDRL